MKKVIMSKLLDRLLSPENVLKTCVGSALAAAVFFGVGVPMALRAYFGVDLGEGMLAGLGCFVLALVLLYVLYVSAQQERPSQNFDWFSSSPGNKSSRPSSGFAHEHIVIAKDGATHTSLIGSRSYGKGNVPPGGHKPTTTIEHKD